MHCVTVVLDKAELKARWLGVSMYDRRRKRSINVILPNRSASLVHFGVRETDWFCVGLEQSNRVDAFTSEDKIDFRCQQVYF